MDLLSLDVLYSDLADSAEFKLLKQMALDGASYTDSSMISSRYSLYDYEKNPHGLTGGRFDCCIYKKFDKLQRIFRNYQKRNIPIRKNGNSYQHIDAYDSFELVPLLIIENAVKYAYYSSEVLISFNELAPTSLDVSVESYSPYISQDDLSRIFDKGFRGKMQQKSLTVVALDSIS